MATSTELATRITEAETALHKLMMGDRLVRLRSVDGSEVEYQQGDVAKLQSYIGWLRSEYARTTSVGPRPIYVYPDLS